MLIYFIVPIVGLVIEAFLSRKVALYIFLLSCLLLSPNLIGYSYIIPGGNQVVALLGLSSAYSLCSWSIEKNKITVAVIVSVFLFIVLSIGSFMKGFVGSKTVDKKWDIDEYRIEYIRDQGFAGGPLMKYELHKYAMIPILIAKKETVVDNDTTGSCKVIFIKSEIVFDKCSGSIKHNTGR
ncbi:hypothetical protein ACFQ21_29445 [Ohtaekwangia kribbensis]|jgi:hypothetical protein|uniref:Uncharacterized protein n=1 Tax=Ohtaekwangia kribbensis TaxID=688913 RepID=A0ABW3KE83_9BACT